MARILILWNQIDDGVYYRRDNRRAPDWDPTLEVEPWEIVEQEIELIEKGLIDGGHDVYHINIRDNFQNLLEAVRTETPDCVVNLIEFFHDDPEQEHNVPALFELLNIPYTGNRPPALSLCQKKPQAKALLTASGLPTPRGIVIERGPVPQDLNLRYPLIVKPAHDDASGGIDAGSVVHDRAQLEARVKFLLSEHTMAVLVEEYIEGREFHCAILGTEALPLYEMRFKGGVDDQGRPLPNIITYRAKWDPYSRDHYAVESKCPPDDLEPEVVAHIQDVALRAFRAVGCRDYARIDMRLDQATGTPYILEINPNPDLADSGAFAQCVRASGRTYGQAMNEIVHYALERARLVRRYDSVQIYERQDEYETTLAVAVGDKRVTSSALHRGRIRSAKVIEGYTVGTRDAARNTIAAAGSFSEVANLRRQVKDLAGIARDLIPDPAEEASSTDAQRVPLLPLTAENDLPSIAEDDRNAAEIVRADNRLEAHPSSGGDDDDNDGDPPPRDEGAMSPPGGLIVTRYVDVSCPARVARTCDRFPVTVALIQQFPESSAIEGSLRVRSDLLVDVSLRAPDFQILGPGHARCSIEGDRVVFFLRPSQLGRGSVTLDFAQGGNPLGTFAIAIDVVEQDIPYDATPHRPRELQMDVGAEPPDYVLMISYEPRGEHALHFCLRSREDLDHGRTFASVSLHCDPDEFMRGKYRDLDLLRRGVDPVASVQLGTIRALAHDQIEDRLQKLGYWLWKMLIPSDLKEYYAKHRDEWRDKTFVVISDEPLIPWELVWPYDDTSFAWQDPDPWCLTLRLSRWLRRDKQGNGNAGPPSSLPLTQLATLIPSDTGLPAIRAESEYLRAFAQRHGVRDGGIVPAIKSDALYALSAGSYDWLHAAAHGTAREVTDKTIPVWLENGEALTPDEIVGPKIERHIHVRRPAFVLNACTAARAGWELTGMSGWANQLIRVGAGLFLAPLWSVTDGVAREFVQAFYDELAKNARVADAMRTARLTARSSKGDPTWMAYVLFAHPNARIEFGPSSRTG